jgi:3-hydroxyisobutyrate dehydrogenase-like beta-hydroxyacid dehydrogenase
MKIGFIGFGEAGSTLARGLRAAGVTDICAYDVNTNTTGLGKKIRERADESKVCLVDSNVTLASMTEVLLSTVTANCALEAANQTAPHLKSHHFYADLNSVSPALKQSIDQVITASSARFVEVAIMSAVLPHGHRVPMLLGGPHAQAFADLFTPFGMRLEVLPGEIGAAAATKMCRSIIIKGLEALVLECLMAAHEYGAEDRVLASLSETFPGIDWPKLAGYMIGRVVVHGARRARELEEVAETLRDVGIEPLMAEATARRQDWCASLNLSQVLSSDQIEDYRKVLAAIKNPTKA